MGKSKRKRGKATTKFITEVQAGNDITGSTLMNLFSNGDTFTSNGNVYKMWDCFGDMRIASNGHRFRIEVYTKKWSWRRCRFVGKWIPSRKYVWGDMVKTEKDRVTYYDYADAKLALDCIEKTERYVNKPWLEVIPDSGARK